MLRELTNHLWQSTLFALAAGFLTLAFRRNRAQVRYWLWFTASFKFFVPFALLMSLGRDLETWIRAARGVTTHIAAPALAFRLEQIIRPFSDPVPFVVSTPNGVDRALIAAIGVWAFGLAWIALVRLRGWRHVRAALRSSLPMDLPACKVPAGIEIRCSPGLLEPGVVGLELGLRGQCLHPTLLLPAGITDRLTPSQLAAVLAHEFCHIRRRDNLFASIHMIVEAIFWFHPLVWWIGARLVEERERACDEDVLSRVGEPLIYAEGILNVCRLYLESPLACVSGVTGANLKRRIEAIMNNRTGRRLNRAHKVLLAGAGIAALTLPLVIGLGNAAAAAPPQFEVASIRLSKNPEPGGNVEITPGRFRGKDLALQWLILVAYRIKSGNLSGALPSWTISERYDIDARTGDAASEDRILLALQALLKDRFKLTEHREMKEQPVWFLTIGKNGVKMPVGTCVPVKKDLPNECFSEKREGLVTNLDWRGVSMSDPGGVAYRSLAWWLAAPLKRPVIDRTGLTGAFDVHLRWARDPEPGEPLDDPGAPSLPGALEDQLGLRLESGHGPVEYLVVDHVEKPTDN